MIVRLRLEVVRLRVVKAKRVLVTYTWSCEYLRFWVAHKSYKRIGDVQVVYRIAYPMVDICRLFNRPTILPELRIRYTPWDKLSTSITNISFLHSELRDYTHWVTSLCMKNYYSPNYHIFSHSGWFGRYTGPLVRCADFPLTAPSFSKSFW
jgi:hypothetical protein